MVRASSSFVSRGRLAVAVAVVTILGCPSASPQARAQTAAGNGPYVVEAYYAAKWGYASEFLRLFRKNYYPVLEELKKQGRILSIVAEAPRYHAAGEGRWDLRVRIVWKDAVAALDDHPDEIVRRLFPDRETHAKEEQRRFEILEEHWDVPVEERSLVEPK